MIELKHLDRKSVGLVSEWFGQDGQAKKRLNYSDPDSFWQLLQEPNRHGWLIVENGSPVGFIDLEIVDDVGYFAFFIEKDQRRKGFAKKAVLKLLHQPELQKLISLEAHVEVDNEPSIRTLESSGFFLDGYDKDEFVIMSKSLLAQK